MLMVTFPLWGSAVFGRAPSSPLSVAGVHWGLLGVKPPPFRGPLSRLIESKRSGNPFVGVG